MLNKNDSLKEEIKKLKIQLSSMKDVTDDELANENAKLRKDVENFSNIVCILTKENAPRFSKTIFV